MSDALIGGLAEAERLLRLERQKTASERVLLGVSSLMARLCTKNYLKRIERNGRSD